MHQRAEEYNIRLAADGTSALLPSRRGTAAKRWSVATIDPQKSNAARLAAADTAARGRTGVDVPSAAKRVLHYFPERQ